MANPPLIVAFDTETDGVDTERCHIVTAFVGVYDVTRDEFVESWDWLIDTGHEIPAAAAAVHGISTEHMREWGEPAAPAIYAINQRLDILQRRGLPFTAMNARYDFTLLDRETHRHWPGLRPFHPAVVLDPLILDKHVAPFRKGKRNLVALCTALGVPVEANAHDAGADCLMTARVVSYILTHPTLAGLALRQLHDSQIGWAAEQARGLAAYYRKSRKPTDGIQEEWPVVPRPSELEKHA